MKQLLLSSLLAFFFQSILLISNVSAQESPDVLLNRCFERSKQELSYEAFLDLIHWPSFYQQLPIQNRWGTSSPEEFRQFSRGMMLSPRATMEQFIKKLTEDMKPEQQAIFLKAFADPVALEKKLEQQKQIISKTTYIVSEPLINGDIAEVFVISIYNGKQVREKVAFKKIDRRWFLNEQFLTGLSGQKEIKKNQQPDISIKLPWQ